MSMLEQWREPTERPCSGFWPAHDEDFNVRALLTGMVVKLTITAPDPSRLTDAPERTFVLESGECMYIGRSSSNAAKNYTAKDDNALFDCKVMSKDHAYFEAPTGLPGPLMITDTSKHGTFVNDIRIKKSVTRMLQPGDRIKFGEFVASSMLDLTHRPIECVVDFFDTDIPESPIPSPSVLRNNHFSADFESSESVYSDDYGSTDEQEMADMDSSSPPDILKKSDIVDRVDTSNAQTRADLNDTSHHGPQSPSYVPRGARYDMDGAEEMDPLADEYDDLAGEVSDDGWLEGPEPDVNQRSLGSPPHMSRKTRWDMLPPPSHVHFHAEVPETQFRQPVTGTSASASTPRPRLFLNVLEQHSSSKNALNDQIERALENVEVDEIPFASAQPFPGTSSFFIDSTQDRSGRADASLSFADLTESTEHAHEEAAATLHDFSAQYDALHNHIRLSNMQQEQYSAAPSISKRISIDNLIHSEPSFRASSPRGQKRKAHETAEDEEEDQVEPLQLGPGGPQTDCGPTAGAADTLASINDIAPAHVLVHAEQSRTSAVVDDVGDESEPVRPRKLDNPHPKKKRRLVIKKSATKGHEHRITRRTSTQTRLKKTLRSMLNTAKTASMWASIGSIATIGFLATPLADRLAGGF
ncbi:Hypothetical protein D9617_17g047770 [Elsinoe fawcettii]|nr:Hypothetical protein D9617_17g047770 [Elsinoe fawcettii]